MSSEPFTIIIDSREQRPFDFGPDIQVQVGTLTAGDYSIQGLEEHVAVERKSLPDLTACVGPERVRFKRELLRLRGFHCRGVVIEADIGQVFDHEYRSRVHPAAVLGSLLSWQQRYRIPFIWAGEHGAEVARGMLGAYWRQLGQMVDLMRPGPSCSAAGHNAVAAREQKTR